MDFLRKYEEKIPNAPYDPKESIKEITKGLTERLELIITRIKQGNDIYCHQRAIQLLKRSTTDQKIVDGMNLLYASVCFQPSSRRSSTLHILYLNNEYFENPITALDKEISKLEILADRAQIGAIAKTASQLSRGKSSGERTI